MGLDLEIVLGIVVLTVLGVFLTGPGMWSEKWGWSALRRAKRGTATHADAEGKQSGGDVRASNDARR